MIYNWNTDGDGCLSVSVLKDKEARMGWSVVLIYTLAAGNNPTNYLMLELINAYFNNIGHIFLNESDNTLSLRVTGLINCLIV